MTTSPEKRAGVGGSKHMMSCLPDLVLRFEIDDLRKIVTLTGERFDSELIAAFVMGNLEREHGVRAWRDDNEKDEAWRSRQAPYALCLILADTRYDLQVVRLVPQSSHKASVTLNVPTSSVARTDDSSRRPQASDSNGGSPAIGKIRGAFRHWYEHSFRDARAIFITITSIATCIVTLFGLALAVAVLLH